MGFTRVRDCARARDFLVEGGGAPSQKPAALIASPKPSIQSAQSGLGLGRIGFIGIFWDYRYVGFAGFILLEELMELRVDRVYGVYRVDSRVPGLSATSPAWAPASSKHWHQVPQLKTCQAPW